MHRNSYLDSDHHLPVSKLRLKLKAKHRMAQEHLQHQVDSQFLEDKQISDFRALLRQRLASGPKGNAEEAWCTIKKSLISAQNCLPFTPEKLGVDWVIDAVHDASRRKKKMWMRLQKSPGDEAAVPLTEG